MDSGGNSGSVSSSGDEEYESRTNHNQHQSIPSFLNPSSLTNFGSSPPPNTTADPSHLLSHHHLFDPSPPSSSSTYLQPSNTNFFLNLDSNTRSPIIRSEQPYNLGLINQHNQNHFQTSSPIPLQPQQNQQQQQAPANPVPGARASKKRTRASRRAPTTVLTTDTSNFRAMVQEFTGIPAPPFSASLPFSRSRFDLFGGVSGSSSGIGPLYPNLVRPSPIKPPQNPTNPFGGGHLTSSSSSSSSSSQIFGNAAVDATLSATTYLQSSDQHQHHQGLMMMNNQKQPMMMMRNMLGMQNHGLNMGFHVQSHSHHHLSGDHLNPSSGLNVGSSGFGGAKQSQSSLALDHLNVGLSQAQGAGAGSGSDVNQNVWRAERATGSGSGDMSCNKMNFTAVPEPNSSEFHGDKGGLEINVSNRGEGTVDSWIFPSD